MLGLQQHGEELVHLARTVVQKDGRTTTQLAAKVTKLVTICLRV